MSGITGSGNTSIPLSVNVDFASGIVDSSKKQTEVQKKTENRNNYIQVTDSTRTDTSAGIRRSAATLPPANTTGEMSSSLSNVAQAMTRPGINISDMVAKVLVLMAQQGEIQGEVMLGQANTNNLQFQAGMAAAKQAYKSALMSAVGSFVNAGISGIGFVVQLKGMKSASAKADAAAAEFKTQTSTNPRESVSLNKSAQSSDDAGETTQKKNNESGNIESKSLSRRQNATSTRVTESDVQSQKTNSSVRESDLQAQQKSNQRATSESQDRASQAQTNSRKSMESLESTSQKSQLEQQMDGLDAGTTNSSRNTGVSDSTGTRNSEPLPKTNPLDSSAQPDRPVSTTAKRGSMDAGELDASQSSKTAAGENTKNTGKELEISQLKEQVYSRVNQGYMLTGQVLNTFGQMGQGTSGIFKGMADQQQMEQQSYSQLFGSTSQSFAKISQNIDENRQNVLSMVSGWMSSLSAISRGA